MSVSFYAYIKEGDLFKFAGDFNHRSEWSLGCPEGMDPSEWINSDILEEPNPDYDPRIDVNISQANAEEVLGLLGFSVDEEPILVERFINIVAEFRRKRLGKVSPALEPTVNSEPGRMTMIDCGRPEGYVERILQRLSVFAQATKEYGGEYVGWG